MPDPRDIKAATKKAGYSPYAVVGAMLKHGTLSPAKREDALYKITASILKHKIRRGSGYVEP